MTFFYHHVGIKGSADFDSTVFSHVSIDEIAANGAPDELIDQLTGKFPRGWVNCWGVPSGASSVIRRLEQGDTVLLVKTSGTDDDSIPAMAIVKVYWREQLPRLSQFLWGDNKYTYIFFFDTKRINLTWRDFIQHVDYSDRFDPRGKFYSIDDGRLSNFNGSQGYTEYILSHFSRDLFKPVTDLTVSTYVHESGAGFNTGSLNNALDAIEEETTHLESEPALTDDVVRSTSEIVLRDQAFRIAVLRAYGQRCSICAVSLIGPNGEPEVQAAHIYPKRLNGRDVVQNGLCLCRGHHWAFDVGWVGISDDYR